MLNIVQVNDIIEGKAACKVFRSDLGGNASAEVDFDPLIIMAPYSR